MTMTAPPGLDAAQRSKLERLIIRARMLLESDFAAQAEGRFGIHLDGTIEDEAALPDNTTDKITRCDLEQIVTHLRTLGEDPAGAVARLLREAAFTHLNRLIAIRVAEAIGLLPESLARGPQSRGFRDLGEIMPMLAADYRGYLRLCGDELAADAPVLFDPRNPLLALEPSTAAFDELVALLADPGTTEIWAGERHARMVLPVLQHRRRAASDARGRGSAQLARARRPQPVLHPAVCRRLPRAEHAGTSADRERPCQPATRRAAAPRRPAKSPRVRSSSSTR